MSCMQRVASTPIQKSTHRMRSQREGTQTLYCSQQSRFREYQEVRVVLSTLHVKVQRTWWCSVYLLRVGVTLQSVPRKSLTCSCYKWYNEWVMLCSLIHSLDLFSRLPVCWSSTSRWNPVNAVALLPSTTQVPWGPPVPASAVPLTSAPCARALFMAPQPATRGWPGGLAAPELTLSSSAALAARGMSGACEINAALDEDSITNLF